VTLLDRKENVRTWRAPLFVVLVLSIALVAFNHSLDTKASLALANANLVLAATPPAQSLRTLFSEAKCKRACWQGIEPGVATVETLRHFWNLADATPSVNSGVGPPDADNAFMSWLAKDYPLAPSDGSLRGISVTTWKGTVIQMIVPVEVCVIQIIGELGQPTQVRAFGEGYYLMYSRLGLIFQIHVFPLNAASTTHPIVPAILASEDSFRNFSDAPDSPPVSWQEASKYLFFGTCTYAETL